MKLIFVWFAVKHLVMVKLRYAWMDFGEVFVLEAKKITLFMPEWYADSLDMMDVSFLPYK